MSLPGIKGKRGRTFKPGEEEEMQEYVDEYNAEAEETAKATDQPAATVDMEALLARPGVVALDADASQEELDESLTALRNLTMAAPERSVRWNQRVAKPEDAPDDDDDAPAARPAKRAATKVAGAKRSSRK